MQEKEIHALVSRQRNYFESGATLNVDRRIRALKKLKAYIIRNEDRLNEAIRMDLGKSHFEGYMCETGLTLSEISYMLKHVRNFSGEQTAPTPMAQFPARSYRKPSPYGVVLIMSPWNYPFLCTVQPLVEAIAAGNTVVLKPSAYSPHTSLAIREMIEACFDQRHVSVVTGGRAENTALLHEHFDYIFFTGSKTVGREVLAKAAVHLTPVTLELGGKSPCIVEKSANIRLAAKRIVFGKFLNCGQTCVAPDYIYCDEEIRDELVEALIREIRKQFGREPLKNPDYGKMINEKHFCRVSGLIDPAKVAFGGSRNAEELRIEPTILTDVTWEDAVMQEEIFGPVLPVLTYQSHEECIRKIRDFDHPLAFYLFTEEKAVVKKFTSAIGFGGGCINDTIIHLATHNLGFGGFGESGMGAYHGKTGFDTFTHYKTIVDKKTWLDLPMRYQPYREINRKLVHLFLR